MKYLRIIAAAGACCALAGTCQAELVSAIQAIVDDAIVTYQEVQLRTERPANALIQEYRTQPAVLEKKIEEVRADVLRQQIENQLILHEFKTAGYNLPESVLDELVQENIKAEFGDRATATKTLEARGMSFEKYRQQVRERFIVAQLRLKNVNQEIIISPHKVEQYYLTHKDNFKVEDRIKLRMIVLDKSSDPTAPQAKKMCEEILAKINEGASFAEMADLYSADKRHPGGDWGWYDMSVLRKDWAETAAKLKPGEHSGLIESPTQCCLMQVEEAERSHYKSLAEAREEIETNLRSDEKSRLEKQWIDKLRRKTFVRYF